MRRSIVRGAIVAAVLAIVPGVALAQHEGHAMPAEGGVSPMCSEAQPAVVQTLNAATAKLEAARLNNSAASLRAAIDDFQVALAQLKTLLAPCAPAAPPAPAAASADTSAAVSAAPAPYAITFRPQGEPVRGSSVFEVTLKDPAGQPVTDANVSVVLFMAAMPSMPAMRHETALNHTSGGTYQGNGLIMMSGPWDVTVNVTREGRRVSKQFGLVAK